MSYLLDKKTKQKNLLKITLCAFIFLVLFYFRYNIFYVLSGVSQAIFHPVLTIGNSLGEKFTNLGAYFSSKNSLYLENKNLKSQILESEADRANYATVAAENVGLKEILNRKKEKVNMILGSILSKPNQSLYDTFLVDAGTIDGVKVGDLVFALGNVPVGRIDTVFSNSAKVILFSNAGERTQVVVSGLNAFMEVIGRGGGNFEMIMPKDFTLQKNDQVVLPGINPYILAVVVKIVSDPRDPFNKALLISPINIQELKFVEILR